MKFQNPSLNSVLTGRTDERMHKPKPICSPLFQSWGHKNVRIFCNAKDSHIFPTKNNSVFDNVVGIYLTS